MLPTPSEALPDWLRDGQRRLNTHALGRTILYQPQMTSTNAVAVRWARARGAADALVVTDDQVAGRGRAGRTWHAEPGSNLTLSVLTRPHLPVLDWPLVGLAAAVAVARTFEIHAPGLSALVKWPNDVLAGGRKAAGLLLETCRIGTGEAALVVGIGLNVNQSAFPDLLADRATSLRRVTGCPHDRSAVFATLCDTLEQMLGLCTGTGLSLLLHLYTARLAGLGEAVTFYETATSTPVEGRLTGLTATGALRVETPEGVRTYHAGDLTTHAG